MPSIDQAGEATSRRSLVIRGAAGLTLLLSYVALERSLPRGFAEFAYYPFRPDGLPFAPMRGFTVEQLARHAGGLLLLAPGYWLLTRALSLRMPVWMGRLRMSPRMAASACALSLGTSAVLLLGVFKGRGFTDDELVYRLQARLLSEGRLADPDLPPLPHDVHMIVTRLGVTGKYLFGEPLVQLPGTLLGLPALLHLPLAAASAWLLYRATRLQAGERVARWSAVLLACSPMFMLTTASGLSNPSALFCLASAGYGAVLCRTGAANRGAVLMGLSLAFGVAVRPQSVAPGGLVLGLMALGSLLRARRFVAVGLLLASGSLGPLSIGAYDQALSGSPFTLPWQLTHPVERYGFGRVWETIPFEHNLTTLLQNIVVTTIRWNAWWLGWPLGLGLVVLWLRKGRPMAGLSQWLWMGAAIVLFQLGYYSTGVSDTGPVYFYALLLPGAVLGAHALCRALDDRPALAIAAVVVHLGLATPAFTLEQSARLQRMMKAVHGPVERALAEVEPPALLVVESNPDEIVRVGWIHAAFPQREYGQDAPIVTVPRWSRPPRGVSSELSFMQWARARWPGRHCYYYRFNRQAGRREVLTCKEAGALLSRPVDLTRPALLVPSTARRLGWLY